jgi:hypothetical protein
MVRCRGLQGIVMHHRVRRDSAHMSCSLLSDSILPASRTLRLRNLLPFGMFSSTKPWVLAHNMCFVWTHCIHCLLLARLPAACRLPPAGGWTGC